MLTSHELQFEFQLQDFQISSLLKMNLKKKGKMVQAFVSLHPHGDPDIVSSFWLQPDPATALAANGEGISGWKILSLAPFGLNSP